MSASFFGDEGPTKTIEVLSMNGSLHCKIEWLEKDLIDSTDFVLDLSHRIGALKTSNHSGGMRFLVEERLLSQGQSWSQLGRPQQITVAFQSLTHDFDQELLLAAQNGDIQLVRTILEKFQDPNCQDADGASALFKASQAGHAEVVSLLLGRRADCEQGDSHMSPLMIAVRFWQAEVVKRLLEARASIEQSGESLQSPLQLAVSNSDMQMATLLAHFGAKMDQALQNGRTVLTMAAHCGDIHMVKCLLRARANINQSDEQGLTALTIAARRMQTPLIRLLVDTGADKDLVDFTGQSALAIAEDRGNAEAVRFLLDARASPSSDVDGKTPDLGNQNHSEANLLTCLAEDQSVSEFLTAQKVVGSNFQTLSGLNASKMGWNVYDDPVLQRANSKYVGQSEKEVLADIYLQHAEKGGMPVTPWYSAAQSLSKEFPELQPLSNHAILGRVFQMIDCDHDGILDQDEFVNGIYELLHPTTKEASTLAQRIARGHLANVSNDFSHVKTVAILGAGVAGLQTARHLQEIGIACTIFEKDDEVGGVWRKNYADFGLQVPKELFEFPDFPYPEDFKCEHFPTGPEVQEYIVLYSKTFALRDKIRFKTFVTEVKPANGQRGWQVEFQSTDAADRKTETFDFLVVATGMYGWPPHVPVARGSHKFQGKILHSCTFTDRKQAAGKKVIVVGGGKSAIDNAVSAAKEGTSSTLVCRHWHWPVPRLLLNAVPFKYGTYNRFGHWMLQPYHEEGPVARWFHGTCAPVKWIWWRVVELMFRGQFQIPSDMVPPDGVDTDLFSGGQILNYEFRDMLKDGKIQAISGSIDKFTENGVILTDGTELPADLVIYGTGFAKNYDLFDKLIQEKLQIQKDGLYLYRNIIPPSVPDVAFIGCEVSTFNNILTHGLQVLWLKKMLKGDLKIPTPGAMEKVLEKERAWKRSWMPAMSSRANIWQLHMMKYHDNLLTDMKEARFRKMPNCFGEILMPYTAADYRSLFK